jgi:branched-chain amino acid transport system permease protein
MVGGLLLGVLTTMLGAYVGFISGELELPAAFVVLFLVLLVRPAGIFGRVVVRRA